MITPDDELLPDDSETEDFEQTSQQDIHSIGLDDDVEYEAGEVDETDALNQAYDASESSYTLNLDDEPRDDD
ncbi:hypothetical protein ACFQZS_11290 [Mucilaginibacter calamicampi]|uniref:Uncharacterized protein n=1 Tax=Mucilaginibacter calamicampi TaxID=1302352 RepID=A0ABW2YW92_9SPHI